jgi:hypothetical protein
MQVAQQPQVEAELRNATCKLHRQHQFVRAEGVHAEGGWPQTRAAAVLTRMRQNEVDKQPSYG